MTKKSYAAIAVLIAGLVWVGREYNSEKSEVRESLGGTKYVFHPWTGEQRQNGMNKCIEASHRYSMQGPPRNFAKYTESFCNCATNNYEMRLTSYAEFIDLLPAISTYANPNKSGYVCTGVAEEAAPVYRLSKNRDVLDRFCSGRTGFNSFVCGMVLASAAVVLAAEINQACAKAKTTDSSMYAGGLSAIKEPAPIQAGSGMCA